jgi:lysophospholipase L1-like esterase
MGNRRRQHDGRAWGIAGVAAVGALVIGLAGFALTETNDTPASAGSVPTLPAATATASDQQRAVFVGDSYTAGTGATDASTSFPRLVSDRMGWELVINGCGLDYCPNYVEMIPTVVAAKPDIVFVSGGRNDTTSDDVEAQIDKFYTELRAELPDARIIATSPLGDDDPAPRAFERLASTIEDAVTTVGGEYLDLGQPLEGRPELISDDDVHPNDDGYAAIADTLAPLLPTA